MSFYYYILSFYFLVFILFFVFNHSLAIETKFPESHEILKHELSSAKLFHESNISISQENISRFNRQLDSDVESRFHITKNTIIRTGESRILGAKYLNETVLPNNHDCLTWCLETPNCNAVVYEEKNVHSCYMFDCGSPSTFLCKFTPHYYFISSVLKITQHSYDLQQWGNQVKHEKELAELRTSDTLMTPSTNQKIAIGATEIPLKLNNATKSASKCHHYQFQCVNNSECIAIYNVCDGIPQCPDGSDESVDLKCDMKDTMAKTRHPVETKMNVLNHAPQQPLVRTPEKARERPSNRRMESAKSIWSSSRSDYYQNNDDSDGLGSPFNHVHSQFVAANDPHVQSLNRWSNDYDQYSPHSVPFDQPYNAYDQRIDDQYLSNSEYDSVKHFGNYRQEDVPYWTNQEAAQDPVEDPDIYAQQLAKTAAQYPEIKRPTIHRPLQRRPYAAAYEEAMEKQLSGPQDSIYSNDDLIRASLANHLPIELELPQYEKHREGALPVQNKDKEIVEVKNLSSDESVTTVKPTKHPKPIQRTVLDFKMSVTELYQASRTHSQEANSAILALVMGLTIAVLLFVFLACRIRTIRKRMSRKGRPLAHDADYLVNGMYL